MAGGTDHSIHFFEVKLHKQRPLKFYKGLALRWVPSAFRFGAFAGVMFLYFTDWKIFMDKVPIYRTKFDEKDPIV